MRSQVIFFEFQETNTGLLAFRNIPWTQVCPAMTPPPLTARPTATRPPPSSGSRTGSRSGPRPTECSCPRARCSSWGWSTAARRATQGFTGAWPKTQRDWLGVGTRRYKLQVRNWISCEFVRVVLWIYTVVVNKIEALGSDIRPYIMFFWGKGVVQILQDKIELDWGS